MVKEKVSICKRQVYDRQKFCQERSYEMPKRGENIYRRKDGRWEGRIWSRSASKKRTYRSVYGKSYREVKDKMCRIRQKADFKDWNTHTLSEAAEIWIRSQSVYWKAGTCSAYKRMLQKYIIPCLGNMPIDEITNQTLYEFAEKINREQGKTPLSRNYMFQICSMVRRILYYMSRHYGDSLAIPMNPVAKEQVCHVLLPNESSLMTLEKYLYANTDQDTCIGILLALHTGIRIGELSALTWRDIDLEEGVLYIRRNILRVYVEDEADRKEVVTQVIEQKPKSSDSVRIIPLPLCLLTPLREHRKEEDAYVISGVKAAWAEPRTIQYRFRSILKRCQIEYFNFHMLRHVFASRCVSMGLDVKSLSEILGHSSIQLTLSLYVHSSIQQKRLLMQQYDSLIGK